VPPAGPGALLSRGTEARLRAANAVLSRLPQDLAAKIAMTNPRESTKFKTASLFLVAQPFHQSDLVSALARGANPHVAALSSVAIDPALRVDDDVGVRW
jgi:hypothetical protein